LWWRKVAGNFSLSGLGFEDLAARHFSGSGEELDKVRLSRLLVPLWLEPFTDTVGADPPAEDA
jgi:hypothetical protein